MFDNKCCNVIKILYEVKVVAQVPTGFDNLDVKIPIAIGTIPLTTEPDINPPTYPALLNVATVSPVTSSETRKIFLNINF